MYWRTAIPALSLLCVLASACGGSTQSFEEPDPPVGQPVLPDLMPAPPIDVQMTNQAGRWHISFSSILVNVGDGDFVLRAKRDGGDWRVEQLIPYSTSGSAVMPTRTSLVWGGDGHNHWHVKRVAINRLVRLDRKGRVDIRSARIDSKIGFCFYDHTRILKSGPEKAVYPHETCGKEDDTVIGMGLSSGWNDTYQFVLPGQSIDVSGLSDGKYRLLAEADESAWFREVTRDNNVTWVDFELTTKNELRFGEVVDVGPEPA